MPQEDFDTWARRFLPPKWTGDTVEAFLDMMREPNSFVKAAFSLGRCFQSEQELAALVRNIDGEIQCVENAERPQCMCDPPPDSARTLPGGETRR